MTRPLITTADIQRLVTEHTLKGMDPDEWFRDAGIGEEVAEALIQAAHTGFKTVILELAEMGEAENLVEMFGNACAVFMMAGFELGWESHKQFGGGDG